VAGDVGEVGDGSLVVREGVHEIAAHVLLGIETP